MDSHLSFLIETTSFSETLFDHIPDVVYFIKDQYGRYAMVNQTLVARCGRRTKDELLGHTTREVFPMPLGDRFLEQDLEVLTSGIPIVQKLELHLYPTRLEGWCLTDKLPLRSPDGRIAGIAGISRDLQAPGAEADHFAEVAVVLDHIRNQPGSELRVEALATMAGLSVYQLNRRIRIIFGISTNQLIAKTRIDAASEMLRSGEAPIAEIANACGYFDQSAFSRAFRKVVGLTPRQYRTRYRRVASV
jgi:AraC-like DNA-binding protein